VTGVRVSRVTMVLTMIISGLSAAQSVPRPEPEPEREPVVPGDGLEDMEEAFRVLAEAGVPPTKEELAGFLESADNAHPGLSSPGFPFPVQGSFRVRLGYFQNEGPDYYGKFILETRWLRLRARIREFRSGLRESTGTVEVGGRGVEMRVGELGLVQGHGLLVGAPGRGSSLAADMTLQLPRERLLTWVGSADPRTLSGFGGRAKLGSWSLRFLNGRSSRATESSAPPTRAVQLTRRSDDWGISAAGLAGPLERGLSLAGSLGKRPLSGGFETLIHQSAPGIPPTGAAVLQVGWNPARGSGLEGQLGFADLAQAPGLASRPAVLPGWDGRGFTLRGFTRTGAGLSLRALVHLGRDLDRTGSRNRKEKILIDLQAGKKLSRQIELAIRYRSTEYRTWEWSERYPWQPPRAAASQRRTILSAQVALNRPGMRGRLLVRSYGLSRNVGNGRRSLISFTGRHVLGRAWKLRGEWVTAWGDPVDLVSAICPLTGMVLPRHWGRWRSEMVLGLEWVRGGARVQAAGSLRHAEPGSAERTIWTIWAEAGIRW